MPEVFALLSNPLNLPKWQSMIAGIEQVTPGALESGTRKMLNAE